MPWYKGFEVNISKGVKAKGHTLIDALTNVVQIPNEKKMYRLECLFLLYLRFLE